MRGDDRPQSSMFGYVDLEGRVPKVPLLRPMRAMQAKVDRALAS
jgi:hypothetical protein